MHQIMDIVNLYIVLMSSISQGAKSEENIWIQRNQAYYYFSSESKNGVEARQECLDIGADLASMFNSPENNFVSGQITGPHWIGLYNAGTYCDSCKNGNENGDCRRCRERWQWYDGTDSGSFENWKQDEPNNDEHGCARMNNVGEWVDSRCNRESFLYICENTDPCLESPCVNGSCITDLTKKRLYLCICDEGYGGKRCDSEIDECLSNPCQNRATCRDRHSGFDCLCQQGYEGPLCEADINECESNPCINGASCQDEENRFSCICVSGYTGVLCETEINECNSNPCKANAICTDLLATYVCSCAEGWKGQDCSIDINECDKSIIKDYCVYGVCTNFEGNYSCACDDHFFGDKCDQNLNTGGSNEDDHKDLKITLYIAATLAGIAFIVAVIFFIIDRHEVKMMRKKQTSGNRTGVDTSFPETNQSTSFAG